MKDLTIAFTLNIDTLEEFYRRVEAQEAQTEEERTQILLEMVEEGLIKNVTATKRSKEKYVEDLKKNFNLLEVKKEKE